MKPGILWFVIVALLSVDLLLLFQRQQIDSKFRETRERAAGALVKAEYAAEEEALLTSPGVLPTDFPRLPVPSERLDTVELFLLASVDNCSNCIEDEITRLNQLAQIGSGKIAGIQGYFVDEGRRQMADRFIDNLNPRPKFPISVRNPLSGWSQATTPLVLVVRSRDGKILDAHKPIPEDLSKRDAFYIRWTSTLGLV